MSLSLDSSDSRHEDITPPHLRTKPSLELRIDSLPLPSARIIPLALAPPNAFAVTHGGVSELESNSLPRPSVFRHPPLRTNAECSRPTIPHTKNNYIRETSRSHGVVLHPPPEPNLRRELGRSGLRLPRHHHHLPLGGADRLRRAVVYLADGRVRVPRYGGPGERDAAASGADFECECWGEE